MFQDLWNVSCFLIQMSVEICYSYNILNHILMTFWQFFIYKKAKISIWFNTLASFAPIAFTALEMNDKSAEHIFCKCVSEFEKLLLAMYKAWGSEVCEITLFGGLSNRFSVIEKFLSEDIKKKIKFNMPQYPIIYGLMKDFVSDKNFAENFSKAYKKI